MIDNIDNFLAQEHIIGKDKPLYKLIKQKDIPHIIFFGPPGSGKTTLSTIIAKELECDFYEFNATTFKVEEIRKVLNKQTLFKPLIFIDEIHRLSKNQQEVLLPYLEKNKIFFIGATTDNPTYCLTNGFKSRVFIYEFKKITKKVLSKILDNINQNIPKDSKEYLLSYANGDIRKMLNLFNLAKKIDDFSLNTLKQLSSTINDGISDEDKKYDLISALIKSIRGSDIDASLYYLSKLIILGEKVEYIARRLLILASEDIGNANPNALNLALNAYQASSIIGYPEARIILAQCVIYLASSPKSNSSYVAINQAIDFAKKNDLDIPDHIKNNCKNYKYPHDFNGFVKQNYLSKDIKFYNSKNIGFEKTLNEWIEKIRSINGVL